MLAILSSQISEEFSKKTNIDTIALSPYDFLDAPVNSHADMLTCVIEDTIFCYDDYYLENVQHFAKIKGYKLVRIKEKCAPTYPKDVLLNVLVVGKTIFSRLDSTAKELLDFAKKKGYKLIDINQGYAACSTLVLDDSAITSDVGIYNALLNEGIRALLVTTSGISLKGYNCGFIGGSCGYFQKKLYTFGNIQAYPDYFKIKDFLKSSDVEVVEISAGCLTDYGGIKFILE